MPSAFQLSLSLALQINPENPLITVIPVLQGEVTLHKASVNINSKLAYAPFENRNLKQYFVYCFGPCICYLDITLVDVASDWIFGRTAGHSSLYFFSNGLSFWVEKNSNTALSFPVSM